MLSIITIFALVPTLDTLHLVRTYKADESLAYQLKVDMDASAGSMKLEADVVFKVKKTTEEGADVNMSVRKFSLLRDGADAGQPAPDAFDSPFDKLGLPHVMSTSNEAWVYIVASFAGLVPGKDVPLGESFDINWTNKDKALSVAGKGKAVEVAEIDGVKVVKIEYEVDVKPGDQTPGHVKCTTIVTAEGTVPVSSTGTVAIDEGTIKFSVKRLKS